jgi:hypothetical protein
MDRTELAKIMMKWSLESQDWEVVLALYTIYNIGIPVQYIYKFPQKNIYNSIREVTGSDDIELYSANPSLRELLSLFPQSKWKRLTEWDDSYGYSRK